MKVTYAKLRCDGMAAAGILPSACLTLTPIYGTLQTEEGDAMPVLSMFFGIILRMYNTNEHNPPHFHAYYGDFEAIFSFDGEMIGGELPRRQVRLIQAWVELHREELEADWKLALNSEPIFRIDPLR